MLIAEAVFSLGHHFVKFKEPYLAPDVKTAGY